jgi:death-on-curing protein
VSEPIFFSLAQVETIHARQMARYGGNLGVRDPSGLESAVFHPQNVYFYQHGDHYDIAAAYAFHIAQAQAFVDGNKRTAMGAALAFLELNGIPTHTKTAPLYDAMIGIAERRFTKADLAGLLRRLFPSS